MKTRTQLLRLSFACFLLSSAAMAQSDPSSANRTTPQPAGSIISGRAVFEDTHEPASRERIQLIASEYLTHPSSRLSIPTVVTDERGYFEFKTVAAGQYYVVPQPIDQHALGADPFPFLHSSGDAVADAAKVAQFVQSHLKITVADQSNLTLDLTVWNPHYGRISGHVFDSEGKLAIHSSVYLIPGQANRGVGWSGPTNEAGEFTFFGLTPGEYIIGASPGLPVREAGRVDLQGLSAATTYYPSALQLEQSAPVTVLADRETGNIDIKLISRPLHNISGIVRRRSTGALVTSARLRLVPRETPSRRGNGFPDVSFTSTDTKGEWQFSNVPDGTYNIAADPAVQNPDDVSERFVAAEQIVVLAGTDISDLTLAVSNGIRVSGSISIEGSTLPRSVSVIVNRFQSQAQASVTLEPVSRTNEFTIMGAPDGSVELTPICQPARLFYVKSIEVGGRDLLSDQLEASEGEEIKDVHIVISSEVATLNGRVVAPSGSQVSDLMITLIPKLRVRRRTVGAQPAVRTDDKGAFSLTAAPGDYTVQVLRAPRSLQPGESQASPLVPHDPQSVELKAGEVRTVNIILK